jgi:hypothetical protein
MSADAFPALPLFSSFRAATIFNHADLKGPVKLLPCWVAIDAVNPTAHPLVDLITIMTV